MFLTALNSSHDFLSAIFGILGKFQIYIGKNTIDVFHHESITDVPWDDYGVDIVIDSSGV